MEDRELLELFDRTVRRRPADTPGVQSDGGIQIERHGSWVGVTWSSLNPEDADRAIARAREEFVGSAQEAEWKYYSYDEPPDLASRLERAGFLAGEPEALAIGEIGALELGDAADASLSVERARDEAGVASMLAVQNTVFGTDHSGMLGEITREVTATPPKAAALIARIEGQAVGAARLAFHPGSEFASFWGTATLKRWRGRGVFRTLIGACANEAAARGARFLQADLNSNSEPILVRCGFRIVARTVPYTLAGASE